MKMKKFLTVLLVTIVSVVFFSAETKADIEKSWLEIKERSISLYINVEGNGLCIHSDKQYDHVNIQVVDANGMTIYVDLINIPANEALVIPLPYLPEGNFQVVLSKNNQPIVWYLTK